MSLIDDLINQYKNKKVLVVGLGLLGGGVGIAEFFAKLGAQVTVTDLKPEEKLIESKEKLSSYPITFKLGQQNIDDFLQADLIFKAPKMRWDAPEIVAALAKGIPVEMEVSFFLKHCPCKVIGVTGTRGKSTTTHLIYEVLLQMLPHKVYVAGNLPHISTISLLEKLNSDDTVILEVSSWQLSALHRSKISPPIAVFTSFYPDHLDYYKNLDEYLYDKEAIYMYQNEQESLVISRQAKQCIDASTIKSREYIYDAPDFPSKLEHLKGSHNLENAAAAYTVAKIFQVDLSKAASIISASEGLPHRLQQTRRLNDVTFINDTTSTTPVATIKAIEAMHDKPIVLIMGGNAKNLPYDELFPALEKVAYIVLLNGTFTNMLLEKLQTRFAQKISTPYDDLHEAVGKAYEKAREVGDSYVLFSPAATSFAMFNNEFHRGEEFDRLVAEL